MGISTPSRSASRYTGNDYVYRIIKANNEVRNVRSRGIVYRNDDGEPIRMVGSVLDITEQARAEVIIRNSQEAFRDFASSVADRFWETDENHVYTFVSEPHRKLTVPSDIFVGKQPWEYAKFQGSFGDWTFMEDCMDAHQSFRDLYFYRKSGGEVISNVNIAGKPIFDETGAFKGYRGTFTDVTAEIEAKKRADTAQTRFVNAIESFSDGIVLWDSNDCLVNCNSSYRITHSDAAHLLVPGVKAKKFS